MEALKITDLEPKKFYIVHQWSLKKSKYGDRYLVKAYKAGTDVAVTFWSNSQLFHELSSIGNKRVNFAKLLNIRYSFQIVAESEYNGYQYFEGNFFVALM